MIPYLQYLKTIVDFCQEFKKYVIDQMFTDPRTKTILSTTIYPNYCWFPKYRDYWEILCGTVSVCDMLGIESLGIEQSRMLERTSFLNNPDPIQQKVMFETHIDFIENVFVKVQEEIKRRISFLEKEEMDRLDEALNCYKNGCFYSTIVMSVSAIEFRLFSLMKSKCPNANLEKLTLGQLINEYVDNQEKYGKIIPDKHEPLLDYCNIYRIFSAHPKREKITKPIATSIINMTFAFLLDEDLKRKAEV